MVKKSIRYFCNNSGLYASKAYLVATLILGSKNIFEPSLRAGHLIFSHLRQWDGLCDTAGFFFFIISTFLYAKTKENPVYWRYAGVSTLLAATCVAAGGVREPGFALHVLSMTPTFAAGLFLILKRNAFAGIPEFLSRFPHAYAGILQQDIGQVLFAVFCAIGDAAVTVSDPAVKTSILKRLK